MEEKNVKIKLVGKANPNIDKETKELIKYLEQPHEWTVIDPAHGKNELRRVKINSKDLKLITEIRVFYHDTYIPDFCNYDLNKHPSEWKWVESPFVDREQAMKDFINDKWGDNSIYRYKNQFIQKIPFNITLSPDYIDEKNNYYNVIDLLNDKLFKYINRTPLGFLKEESKYGKRN